MIFLREANESDLPLIMAWRSNPLCYQGYYQQKKPLTWDEHMTWWQSRPSTWKELIIELQEGFTLRPIGMIQLGQLEHWSPEVGYTINPSDWNEGYGKEAVRQVAEWLKSKGYKYCHTTIKDNNKASVNLIQSLGFNRGDEARKGEHWYHKKLF